MKNLLYLLLFLSNLSYGQIISSPISSPVSSPVRGVIVQGDEAAFDPALTALLAKGTAEGYTLPSATVQEYLNTLIVTLKADGVWVKLDVLYIFATDGDSDFATLNLINPDAFQCTKVNSPTFTSLEGFTGNASNMYLNTNWNPNSNAIQYTLNGSSFGYYCRTSINSGQTRVGNPNTYDFSTNNVRVNQGGNSVVTNTAAGFKQFIRTSGSNITFVDNNNSSNISSTSSSIANFPLFVLAANGSGTPVLHTSNQLSVVFAGGDISTEASNFFDAIETYMDANNKGVFF